MANRRLLLVTFVVFCAFFEGTTALKCYSGTFENREGARQWEPLRLRDCESNEDLCLSYYVPYNRDDIYDVLPGGSWGKYCDQGSSTLMEEFNGDFSEKCIETEEGIITCFCNTDGCNHEKELDVKSNP